MITSIIMDNGDSFHFLSHPIVIKKCGLKVGIILSHVSFDYIKIVIDDCNVAMMK